MRVPQRTQQKKQRVSLLGVIANGSTGDARRLLKKYGEPDATNHKDLEVKLSKLYAKTDDKIQIEKEFAEIHPHKEFILQYLAPKPIVSEPEITIEEVEAKTKAMATGGCGCGNPNCRNSQVSNACGCSGADGSSTTPASNSTSMNSGIMVLGILGIIGIFALSLRR
jgi:hypothetical protein